MTIFQQMVNDVFQVVDFTQSFRDVETNKEIICIAFSIENNEAYTQFGVDDGISFYLTCKKNDYVPRKNNKIIFRNQIFKIDNFSVDSFNLSWRIFLKSEMSK